ncbi:hypothetical protein [Sphingobium yanoikuyae]|uniref:acyltransferase n=1 Tax=Sphingobium yanoikuyae TaxID=13690 RepID=UPI0028AAEEE5|nr:hypothetical protein [Sphingobium yanoikuyae]
MLIKSLQPYADDKGNLIDYSGDAKNAHSVDIEFLGNDNTLTVSPDAHFSRLKIMFKGHGNNIVIGRSWGARPVHWAINVGHGCTVDIGDDVTTTNLVYVTAAEGVAVRVGKDCMFATAIELRATDSHAIYDKATGGRINHSADVIIGDHCWLATGAVLMPGANLGSGCVLGHRATLLGPTGDDCVVVGSPARVVRTGIEWRRPQTLDMPAQKYT